MKQMTKAQLEKTIHRNVSEMIKPLIGHNTLFLVKRDMTMSLRMLTRDQLDILLAYIRGY
jgi:hypothetical protein